VIEVVADDNLIGGMTYWVESRSEASVQCRQAKEPAMDSRSATAGRVPIGIKSQTVSQVCVKEIVIGLKVKNDDCC
jgi:hypothetical protein